MSRQLQLDLDDRPQVAYIYPGTPLTGKIGRLVEIRGRIAFVYFEGIGIQMCRLTNLEGGNCGDTDTGNRPYNN